MPHCNKCALVVLAGALLIGCSGKPVRERAGDAPDSAPAAAKAPEKLPRDYDKALVLMQSGDYGAAIPALQAFIDDEPDHAGPYINLGIAYRLAGEPEQALAALNKALEINPASAEAQHQLGIVYREKGNFAAALSAYEGALKLNPEYALAHRNIGILYDLYLLKPAQALTHYRRYQTLAGGEDKAVEGWIVDLERRSGLAQAGAAQ